ncbi:N-6 DNA methylase [Candidatus Woesearchaeota archaeon]|nr:N-6 DNA methylase [Candidatus Woesearchaeota archaeon]
MIDEKVVRNYIAELLSKYEALPNKYNESEKRTEEFIRPLLELFEWHWLTSEVMPQQIVKTAIKTTRVDYAFRKSGELRPSFLIEAKRFSDGLTSQGNITQVLNYGKNSGIRWIVLTNFVKWRVFNSDYFDDSENAEIFEFSLAECLTDSERLSWLLLFSKDNGGVALDEYAKMHKKWKESADIEELLTEQLLLVRKKLGNAIKEQNLPKFDTGQDIDAEIDACVQTILDRIIFCRMLEDSGGDSERKLMDVLEKWQIGDKRIQFYKDFLCPFFLKMHDKYDSTIFDLDRVDRLVIKNDDFIMILQSFYTDQKTGLRYNFAAINSDILGHAYENYLSYRATAKRKGVEEEKFKRKQGGIYYTKEFLVEFLVDNTLGKRLRECKTINDVLAIRVLDPACGSGTFLVRAFEEFKRWFQNRQKVSKDKDDDAGLVNFLDHVLENCIYGIDLDPRAVRLTRLNMFLRSTQTPKPLPKLNIIERNSLIWDNDDSHAFKIEEDFPLVAETGGFDIVLGNPPWEKWKPDSQEFFEQHDQGFKSLTTQKAKKRMEELMKNRPILKKLWKEKLYQYEFYSTIFRKNYHWQSSDANGRKVSGDLDLYKIFTERAHQLIKNSGLVGFVVPSGIYTDLGAKGLRTMLFEKSKINCIYGFENRRFIFPNIDQRYKFVLLIYEKGGKTKEFPCAFFLHRVEDLYKAVQDPTIINIEFIKKSSPTSWNILEIKTPEDYKLVQKLLKSPPLGQKINGTWNVAMQSGFHMTNDSHLFKIESLTGIPLLEGKNIEQFTHQWKEAPISRYRINEKDILANLNNDKLYYKDYWMAYRLIASSTNYRTFISTIVPPGYVCGHSIAIVKLPDIKQLCFLVGVMNSFIVDYFIRQKVSANVTMFNFLETPVPRLSSGKEFDFIVRKVAQLVSITEEFTELKKLTNISVGLTKETDRALARAQLDVAVAHLYDVTKEELEYILKQFPAVDQKQKELVLSQY